MSLDTYQHKRNFERTPEPRGKGPSTTTGSQFVVQKHAARRLHYDFRLELDGALKSWAVPKGPSLDPHERRLAVPTEDHPLEYAAFEGVIPAGEYGGGAVLVWDRGTWEPEGDPHEGLARGKLTFRLHGEKLRGRWTLVRSAKHDGGREQWLLIKRRDGAARESDAAELVDMYPESVLSGRDIEAVAQSADAVWSSEHGAASGVTLPEIGDLSAIEGAVAEPMPAQVRPQLATRVEEVPEGSAWLHEPKLDGYRLVCRKDGARVQLFTRAGLDWTSTFPVIAQAVAALPCEQVILDGEAVVLDAEGRSVFQLLQNAIGRGAPNATFVAFDVLYLDGWSLCGAPLRARKEQLRVLMARAPAPLRYGDHVIGRGDAFFRQACKAGLEGIVSKRADAPYRSGRTTTWLKIKCQQREELVVVGFTDPGGTRQGLGALLLATRGEPGGPLRYAGKVGTGFTDATLRELRARLDPLVRSSPPFEARGKGSVPRRAHWVEPVLVAEVAFSEWTQEGRVRQPVFQGLREDKPAPEVTKERVVSDGVAGVRISNRQKILFAQPGITKLELARYYEQVAPWAVPLLARRPLTLLRCPEGQEGDCFYQKRLGAGAPASIKRVEVKPGAEPYAMIENAAGLVGLVQLGVLEVHAWGSRADALDRPDVLVLDLDPAEDVAWSSVVEAAFEVRRRITQLDLVAFVRVTGGKGVHVVVPIEPGPSWAYVKQLTHALARYLTEARPALFVANMAKRKRTGKIYVDYLRNAREATAIASYSPRAKPGAPVAMPLEWAELEASGERVPRFGVRDVPQHLAQRRRDPWQDFEDARRPVPRR